MHYISIENFYRTVIIRAVVATALIIFNLKSNTMKTQCKYSNYVF